MLCGKLHKAVSFLNAPPCKRISLFVVVCFYCWPIYPRGGWSWGGAVAAITPYSLSSRYKFSYAHSSGMIISVSMAHLMVYSGDHANLVHLGAATWCIARFWIVYKQVWLADHSVPLVSATYETPCHSRAVIIRTWPLGLSRGTLNLLHMLDQSPKGSTTPSERLVEHTKLKI